MTSIRLMPLSSTAIPDSCCFLNLQHRLFLETAWEAIEDAGYNTEAYKGALGVYAGASKSNYGHSLSSDSQWADAGGAYQLNISTGGDFLPTRVSYKLDLQGPSSRSKRLLHVLGGGAYRLPEFAQRRVRYGVGRRRFNFRATLGYRYIKRGSPRPTGAAAPSTPRLGALSAAA